MVHIFQCILLRTVRRKLTNLERIVSPETDELIKWLEKNVGLLIDDKTLYYRQGDGWMMYIRDERIDNVFTGKKLVYVQFDARKIKRAQMTWFRMRWAA
jgi:hypothetical protein